VAPVSLQINLTPLDLPLAALILPHQLRCWASQCQELLLIWDLEPHPQQRHEASYQAAWQACLELKPTLLAALQADFVGLRSLELDISAQAEVAHVYAQSDVLPTKDFRGGPFYAYFFGLHAAAHDWVLHLDADMLFAGQAAGWVAAAQQALQSQPELLCCAPPGGPPAAGSVRQPRRLQHFTTRCFFLDRRRLAGQLQLRFRPCGGAELPEHLLSQWMQQAQLQRLDLPVQGVWSLHPSGSRARFRRILPELLRCLESGAAYPSAQVGEFNLHPDWLAELEAALELSRHVSESNASHEWQ